MENNKEKCCEDAENLQEQLKDKYHSDDGGCGCDADSEKLKDDGGCGCGALEFPDQSLVDNPAQPEFLADEEFIKDFENYAHSIGISSVGYAQLTPELLIVDKFIQYPNAIVLTMEMDKKIIETAPGEEANRLNDLAYEKLGKMTFQLSDYLREHGFATEVAHPFGGLVNFAPLAQKAGMGFIGQNGLLITPELGPRQKISAIFTSILNLPSKEDNPHTWIPDYCERCGKCVKACPEKALVEKETCCGGKEVVLIQNQCIGCSQGCTYCIEDCPFHTKGYEHIKNRFDKMTAKLKEKKNKNRNK